MFNNNPEKNKEPETIIGQSVKVDGNFKSEGNIIVEGVVNGSLKTTSSLTIGQNAKIKAEVEAKNLFLEGEIKGNVKVFEKTVLKNKSKIIGNLETVALVVEEGAILNGKCMMLPEQILPEVKKSTK